MTCFCTKYCLESYLSPGAGFSDVQKPPHTVVHSSPAHIVTPKTCRQTEHFQKCSKLSCCLVNTVVLDTQKHSYKTACKAPTGYYWENRHRAWSLLLRLHIYATMCLLTKCNPILLCCFYAVFIIAYLFTFLYKAGISWWSLTTLYQFYNC